MKSDEKLKEVQEGKGYKSPQRKLVKFFEKSRDRWKAKCCEAKIEVKRLKNRVWFLEKSKERWKNRVKQSNGEEVFPQLEDTIPKTGLPREIRGDQGSDLKSGIERFCQEHQETCHATYTTSNIRLLLC